MAIFFLSPDKSLTLTQHVNADNGPPLIYIYTVSQKSEYTHHISAVNLVYISGDNTIEMKLGYILE